MLTRNLVWTLVSLIAFCSPIARAQGVESAAAEPRPTPTPEEYEKRSLGFSERIERTGLADDFAGVTTDGHVVPGLFELRSTGVSTAPVATAANDFLAALTAEQRARARFPVEDEEWRKWANQHIYHRDGVSFEEMSDAQRKAAFGLLAASLSAKGLQLSRDIMRLNETLGELNNGNFVEYGEWKYFITIMGHPSADQPWGWQLDGHHLNVNYFVLGDQVVMTPAFWGSEPVIAKGGKYAGTRIMEAEQDAGLKLVRALTDVQRGQAILDDAKPGNNALAQAFSDNLVLDYAGVKVASFNDAQRSLLLDLVALYVGNLREGHAEVHLAVIESYLDETNFAWIGGTDDGSVFYYRIHSPVTLIEFDHQRPVGLKHLYPDGPNHEHVHSVIRTPNGNDYGRDLLRQHYDAHAH